jgi:hypothetical protein
MVLAGDPFGALLDVTLLVVNGISPARFEWKFNIT